MDVTPRELRDTDIREGFRGYHRDDVDELLERAASTIEGLSERVRQMNDRLATAENSAGRSREAEERLQRTLVLAQKTADEAVADAQQRARQLLDESEKKARTLVTEAEASARHITETEHRRLHDELQDLAARRDALLSDVDELERFEAEYRTRLRGAIESELDSLGKFSIGMTRPSLHDVEVPPPREEFAPPRPVPPSATAEPVSPPVGQPTVELGSVEPFPEAAPPPRSGDARDELERDPTGAERVPSPKLPPARELSDFVPDEPVEAEVLDDDAFFATLREAVRDDAPLGPRDGADATGPFEHVESQEPRRRFRRRR